MRIALELERLPAVDVSKRIRYNIGKTIDLLPARLAEGKYTDMREDSFSGYDCFISLVCYTERKPYGRAE